MPLCRQLAVFALPITTLLPVRPLLPHHYPPPAASYQLAFGAVRQLGVLLRNALTMKSADAFKEVYCWQVGRLGLEEGEDSRVDRLF